LTESDYKNYEDKLLHDTIKYEDGNWIWASDKTVIEDIDNALATLSLMREMQNVTDSLSNLDIKSVEDIRKDSILKVLNKTPIDSIENMSFAELTSFSKSQDEILGIDRVYKDSADYFTSNIASKEGDLASYKDSQNLYNKLAKEMPPVYRHAGYEDLSEDIYSLMSAMSPKFPTPWLENDDRSVTTLGGERDRHDFRRDFGDFTNFLGLGPQVGQDIGTGVHRLSSFLDYYLNPF
tara:strand:+ start:1287 stop:1994 length:708 start_codon:yes stop_codon:yes gene_type:complete